MFGNTNHTEIDNSKLSNDILINSNKDLENELDAVYKAYNYYKKRSELLQNMLDIESEEQFSKASKEFINWAQNNPKPISL